MKMLTLVLGCLLCLSCHGCATTSPKDWQVEDTILLAKIPITAEKLFETEQNLIGLHDALLYVIMGRPDDIKQNVYTLFVAKAIEEPAIRCQYEGRLLGYSIMIEPEKRLFYCDSIEEGLELSKERVNKCLEQVERSYAVITNEAVLSLIDKAKMEIHLSLTLFDDSIRIIQSIKRKKWDLTS